MPVARITVTAVSDEGDTVIVWGRTEHTPEGSEPVGFAFQTKGEDSDVGLAERASRLAVLSFFVSVVAGVTTGLVMMEKFKR